MKINYEEYLLNLFNEIAKISNEKASIRNCLKIKVLTDVISSIYLIMGLKKGQWIIQRPKNQLSNQCWIKFFNKFL